MPAISMFYGIQIRMFFEDIERHRVAHIHAEYQGQVGTDLLADWALAVEGKKPFPIKGLDQ